MNRVKLFAASLWSGFRKNTPMWLLFIAITIGGGLFLFHPTQGYLTKKPEVTAAAKKTVEKAKEAITPITLADASEPEQPATGTPEFATGTQPTATGTVAIPAELTAKLMVATLTCSNVAVEFLDRCNTVCGDFKVPAEVGGCVDGFNKKVVANRCDTGANPAEKVICVASVFTHDTVTSLQREARQFAVDVEREYNEFIKPLLTRTDANAAEAASGTKRILLESRVHYQQTGNGFAALGVPPAKLNAGIPNNAPQIVDSKTIEELFSESPAGLKPGGSGVKPPVGTKPADDKGSGSGDGDKNAGGTTGGGGDTVSPPPTPASAVNACMELRGRYGALYSSIDPADRQEFCSIADKLYQMTKTDPNGVKGCIDRDGLMSLEQQLIICETKDRFIPEWRKKTFTYKCRKKGVPGDACKMISNPGQAVVKAYASAPICAALSGGCADFVDKRMGLNGLARNKNLGPKKQGGGGQTNQTDACGSGGSCIGPGTKPTDGNMGATPDWNKPVGQNNAPPPSNAQGVPTGPAPPNVAFLSATPYEAPAGLTGGAQSTQQLATAIKKGPDEKSGLYGGGKELLGSGDKLLGPKDPLQN